LVGDLPSIGKLEVERQVCVGVSLRKPILDKPKVPFELPAVCRFQSRRPQQGVTCDNATRHDIALSIN